MPNDAKLGLVIGIAAFIAVAVLFYHKDLVPDRTDRVPAGLARPGAGRPKGYSTSRAGRGSAQAASLRRHTVTEGDSLYALAEKFYGDGDRFIDLYLANKSVLRRPDELKAGTVLVVPDLGDDAPEARVAAAEPAKAAAPPPLPAKREPSMEESPKEESAREPTTATEPAASPEPKAGKEPAPKEEAAPSDRVTDKGSEAVGEDKADAAALPPLPPIPGLAGSHP